MLGASCTESGTNFGLIARHRDTEDVPGLCKLHRGGLVLEHEPRDDLHVSGGRPNNVGNLRHVQVCTAPSQQGQGNTSRRGAQRLTLAVSRVGRIAHCPKGCLQRFASGYNGQTCYLVAGNDAAG